MLGRLLRAIWGLSLVLLVPASAFAVVLQPTPGGVTIPIIYDPKLPCADKNVEACLDMAEGDPTLIDAQKDALTAPETFQPTCQLTFTPIVKGGTIYDVFGWYNVKPNPLLPGKFIKPLQTELFGMFEANDWKTPAQLAGQQQVLDLGVEQAAGRYKGGQIGFFLVSSDQPLMLNPTTHAVTGNVEYWFFTQHELNEGSTANQTYYNVLTWESVAKKNTFYFGWEDLPPSHGIDNDFDDFLFSVEGVQCGGGGQACDTGNQGVCAAGVMQCKKGVVQCVQTLQPAAEQCNALDDDCNGMVDDGDGLCKDGEVCNRGVCVPRCGTAEFRCSGDTVCNADGVCVDKACKDMQCEAGKVCHEGNCVDSCSDITCPHGLACRNGGCVDPCLGVECDEGFACVLGVCSSCECSSCVDGTVCTASPSAMGVKLCIDSGCENQTCAAHQHCSMGQCVSDCDGATCPTGQLCQDGACVSDGTSTAGTGGTNGTGGTDVVIIDGGTTGAGATGATGSGLTGAGANRAAAPVVGGTKSCGCSVPGGSSSKASVLVLLGLVGLLRRRRATTLKRAA